MFKSFREWIRIPMSEALLIGASGGVLGWYGSRFDLAAIVGVLFLARFRRRGQSVVGAFSFSLFALVSAIAGPRFPHASVDLAQVAGAACAIWLCAILDSGSKPAETATAGDNVWESLLKLFPGWMWIARPDGTLEFVSRSGLEYSGITIEKVLAKGLSSEACTRTTASARRNTGKIC
jgi:hypothetical protein